LKLLKIFLFLVLSAGVNSMATAQIKSWEDPLPSGPVKDDYQPGPDSLPQEGVPQGEVFGFEFSDSKIFPGTVNNISVYVPDQYTGEKPACVYVGLDGLGYNAVHVFNNLIHKKEMPVVIGIGIAPGFVPSANGENPRFNRSFEFDGISDAFCRFLIDEIFPEVEKHKTAKGLEIKLSDDPNDRCCGGGSTGGIGSFSLAWQRPDQFRRVFSGIGTYVCMRGGDQYSVLVRKTEPKPIRIFMQDGHHDQCMGDIGDWWMENVTLKRALEYTGYDVQWVWGTGIHSGNHGTQVFPDAMRALWRDYPAPVVAMPNPNFSPFYNEIIQPDSTWTETGSAIKNPTAIFPALDNTVYCVDAETSALWKFVGDAEAENVLELPDVSEITSGVCSADGTIYLAGSFGLHKINPSTKENARLAEDLSLSDLTISNNGNIYATDATTGTLWLIKQDGTREQMAQGLAAPVGIGITPDLQWLVVMESESHFGSSFKIENDGKASLGQRFYWFHVPDFYDGLGSGRCTFDTDGRLYAATRMGVAALDRNGRTRLIMPSPLHGGQAAVDDLCFGGSDGKSLFILTEGRIFKRTLKTEGAPNFTPPKKLPPWGAG